jgi:hypothetical protein
MTQTAARDTRVKLVQPKPAPKLRLVSPPAEAVSLELPLSWSWNDSPDQPEHFSFVTLPGGAKFVYAAQLSPRTSRAALVQKLRGLGPVIIRGCSAELARELAPERALSLGSSARIDLEGYRPPHKVRNLAKRGAKAVEVRALPMDAASAALVTPWLASLHGEGEPTLQYLFRTELADAQRAFAAFQPGSSRPMGLVTLTRYGTNAWHVELLCRDPQSPQGTMEHLLASVIETLQSEGATALNLGEIGLDFSAVAERLSWLNRLLLLISPFFVRLVRGRYDVGGLHRFKNKFEPVWEPRFFVGGSLLELFATTRVSGVSQLVSLRPAR